MKKILLLLSLFSFSLNGQISISNNFVAGTAIKISNDTISGNYAAGTNISITNGTISASGGSGTVTSFSFTNA